MMKLMSILQRITDLGYTLPAAPSPVANYVPAIIVGNELRTSGQIPVVDGELVYKGSVPSQQSIQNATEAAKICGLNAIAVAQTALEGKLNRIEGVLQLRCYVASDIGFDGHSTVANGVSDLMVEILGEEGRHSRVAMGSIGLPLGATVEVEVVFKIVPDC
jgi:enamine deaminase RidA (YjgF/YER057c/UK114 family)